MDLIKNLRIKPPTYEDAVAAADEIERLREALEKIANSEVKINAAGAWSYCVFVAQAALQQKDSE